MKERNCLTWRKRVRVWAVLLVLLTADARAAQWSGYIELESRLFPQSPIIPEQKRVALSLGMEPEYYREWRSGEQSITFKPFVRLDGRDSSRSHFDIRELTWRKKAETWELRVGVRKVFWGVTESQHLVDIVNQTDLVEDPDGEEKLGQPMVNLGLIRKWGTLDFFIMPYFRERTFPGREGRLQPPLPVDTDRAGYESTAKRFHPDLAVRWSHSLGKFDLGLSHFYGTSREPTLILHADGDRSAVLIPRYDLIHQTGLDLQLTSGGWLWKLEAIHRDGPQDRFFALTGGFEYSFIGVFKSKVDLGLLAEYLYDERGNQAATPFENDVFLGARIVLNDVDSTEALVGGIIDYKSGAGNFLIEASRRFGASWKLSLEGRLFANNSPDEFFYAFRRDSYLQIKLKRYF